MQLAILCQVVDAAVNHVVNWAGVTFLSRMMAGGKAGVGEVIAAYAEVERASEARALRKTLLEAGPEAAHQGLIELEQALEAATRDALDGKGADAGAVLEPVRSRLKRA